MTKKRDHDLDLKLRFRRILYAMGYYVPLEVELSQFVSSSATNKRASITDLDVLGIAYDELLVPRKVVGDCKTGRNIQDVSRLFWLKGVADYFGATDAYLVKTHVNSHARAIAPKLGLRVLGLTDLEEIEKNFKVDAIPVPIADADLFEATEEQLLSAGTIPDEASLKKLLSYLRYGYWYFDSHRNIFQLVHLFSDAAHLLKPAVERDKLICHIGVERFAQSILDLTSQVLGRDLLDVARSARVYLYGGSQSLRERESFIALLNKFTGRNDRLDPDYLPALLDLIQRLLAQPVQAKRVLHYLQTAYLWCVQCKHKTLQDAYLGHYDVGSVVAMRDVCITFCKVAGLDDTIFSEIFAQ